MRKRDLLVFVGLTILLSCKTSVKVTNINNIDKYNTKSVMYYLPETVIKVDVKLIRTVFTKGQYNEYADKYLNIANAERKDFVKYAISDVNIDSYGEPDNTNGYIITGKGLSDLKINLTDNLLLTGINNISEKKSDIKNQTSFLIEKDYERFFMTDLLSKSALNETEDTTYRRVMVDSVVMKVPVINKQNELKTTEIKAEEVASLIIKIRKKRLKLLYGDVDSKFQGESVKSMLDKLSEIENNYLSLFIGHKTIDTLSYSFEFTPNINQEISNNILFYFSEKSGIASKNVSGFEPVTIKVLKCGKTNVIESYKAKNTDKKSNNGLVYRIPDCGLVQIYKSNEMIASNRILIAQYGSTSEIPSDVVVKKNVKIEINPNLGSLKSIE